jgi:hypothetical protein
MPDMQELFRMATQKVRPDPGFVGRQNDYRRKRERKRRVGAFAVVGTIAAVAIVVAIFVADSSNDGGLVRPAASTGVGPTVGPSQPAPTGVGPTQRPSSDRLTRTVDGVRFSFIVPAFELDLSNDWGPGPIERVTDGFREGSLYISKSIVGPQGAEAVVFWTSFPDGNEAHPCVNLLSPPVGPSTTDLAAAVATAFGTELVTGPSDVTVGGRPAKHVVVTVRQDVGCDPGFFYAWQDEMWGSFWGETNIGDTIMVWIVEVDGKRLFIEAETTKQGTALQDEIQQIVESIRFG